MKENCCRWIKLEKIMNEKMSKRKIQIKDLQKQEIEEL
jgi:hypothetical protein